MKLSSSWGAILVSLLLATTLLLGTVPCAAGEAGEMTYMEALAQIHRLATKVEQIAIKTTQSIVRANHWHQMENQARAANKDVARLIRNAAKLIARASQLGIAFSAFDIEVFNAGVGRWIVFDPIHIVSSGD